MKNTSKESKEKNTKEQLMSDIHAFAQAINEMSRNLGTDLNTTIELYKAFQLFCIHQHLEQLVYKK